MFSFFHKNSTGIDISDHSIETLQLDRKLRIISFGRMTLKKGVVENGKIKRSDELIQTLQNISKRAAKSRAIISIPESQTFIHTFDMPHMPNKQDQQKAIIEKALKLIPFNKNDIYWDFEIQSLSPQKNHVLFAAAQKTVVDEYRQILRGAHLDPFIFDLESASIGRALLSKQQHSAMIVDIGARITVISVFDHSHALNFSVTIPSTDKERVIHEIRRAMEYMTTNGQHIEKIILAGGSSLAPSLDIYMAKKLGMEVRLGDPLASIKNTESLKKDTKNPPLLFATVIGLALRGLRDDAERAGINLLRHRTASK